MGEYPYTPGQSCSRCTRGDYCRNRLCSTPRNSIARNGHSRNRSFQNRPAYRNPYATFTRREPVSETQNIEVGESPSEAATEPGEF